MDGVAIVDDDVVHVRVDVGVARKIVAMDGVEDGDCVDDSDCDCDGHGDLVFVFRRLVAGTEIRPR